MSAKNGNGQTSNGNNHNHRREKMFSCPCCGLPRKVKEEYFVCFFCKQEYEREAATALAQGNPVPQQLEWVLNRARTKLPKLERTHKAKTENLDKIKRESRAEAEAFIEEHAGNVSESIKAAAIRERTSSLYGEKGGNKAFAQLKDCEDSIKSLREAIETLETKLADKPEAESEEPEAAEALATA